MAKFNVKDSDFLYGTAGGAPATIAGQVADGSVDLGEVSLVEVTTKDNATKQNVAGVRDTMGGSFTLVWDPALASHAALMTAYLAKTKTALGFKLSDNTPAQVEFFYGDGYITNISAPIASGGGNSRMECSVSFKLSGPYTRAA
jgi:uncharacterized lipoprotein YajG